VQRTDNIVFSNLQTNNIYIHLLVVSNAGEEKAKYRVIQKNRTYKSFNKIFNLIIPLLFQVVVVDLLHEILQQ